MVLDYLLGVLGLGSSTFLGLKGQKDFRKLYVRLEDTNKTVATIANQMKSLSKGYGEEIVRQILNDEDKLKIIAESIVERLGEISNYTRFGYSDCVIIGILPTEVSYRIGEIVEYSSKLNGPSNLFRKTPYERKALQKMKPTLILPPLPQVLDSPEPKGFDPIMQDTKSPKKLCMWNPEPLVIRHVDSNSSDSTWLRALRELNESIPSESSSQFIMDTDYWLNKLRSLEFPG